MGTVRGPGHSPVIPSPSLTELRVLPQQQDPEQPHPMRPMAAACVPWQLHAPHGSRGGLSQDLSQGSTLVLSFLLQPPWAERGGGHSR